MTINIENLAKELGQKLQERSWQCVTAESCTGGGLSYAITSIPGSSAWFERGFITYSNAAKQELLGVKNETLHQFGAVSGETAREMAAGALEHSHAQVSIAITGIAGPDGGTHEKPVGTVWIATALKSILPHANQYQFHGNRSSIRDQAIVRALQQTLALL